MEWSGARAKTRRIACSPTSTAVSSGTLSDKLQAVRAAIPGAAVEAAPSINLAATSAAPSAPPSFLQANLIWIIIGSAGAGLIAAILGIVLHKRGKRRKRQEEATIRILRAAQAAQKKAPEKTSWKERHEKETGVC